MNINMNKSAKKNFDLGRSRKIFINHMNSWFSNFVIEELRTEAISDPKIVKNEFMGTKNNTNLKLPYLFEPTEIKIEYNPHFENDLFKNDVFIYNLEDADLNEIEYIIKGLKTLKHTSEKTLILITSIMTWARTSPKTISYESNEKQAAENTNAIPTNPLEKESNLKVNMEKKMNQENDLNKNTNNNKIIIPFEDSDYPSRLPTKKYHQFKMIETIALTASNVNPMLKTYIICPGLIYGCGEQIFYDYFKMAWMNEPGRLPVIGDGNNSIPTIHIKDMAALVRRVVERGSDEKYIFAVDRTKNRSLNNIIESISKSVGSGHIENIIDYSAINKIPSYNIMSIDIQCKSSKLFEDKRGDYEDKEDFVAKKFKWHCEFGIAENLEKLRKEFNLYRNLKPIKIFICGPPASGKSTLSQYLSQQYDLPIYNVKEIIESAKNLSEEDPLNQEINTKLEEIKDKMIIEHEEAQKKMKTNKKKIEPLDRNALNPRLPDELVIKIFNRYINTNVSRNKGYILDGYPKTYKDCQGLFCKNDYERAETDSIKLTLDHELAPNNVIRLDMASEEFLKSRLKTNTELINFNPLHHSDENFSRRFGNFRNFNETARTNQTLASFFVENNIELFSIDCKIESNQIFSQAKRYIESKGKIRTFKKKEDIIENYSNQHKHIDKSEIENIKENELTHNLDSHRNSNLNQIQKNQQKKLDMLKEREKLLLEKKSEIIRHYINENVIPILSKGILEICEQLPDDPVDFLSYYLYANSSKLNENQEK